MTLSRRLTASREVHERRREAVVDRYVLQVLQLQRLEDLAQELAPSHRIPGIGASFVSRRMPKSQGVAIQPSLDLCQPLAGERSPRRTTYAPLPTTRL